MVCAPDSIPSSPGTALCSWARHFSFTVPLSIQVYKSVLANLKARVSLQWSSNSHLKESRNIWSCFMLRILR